ncbi:MAG: hypothetical protein GY867_03000, partial [bacterium]|nr:hypothetical protein [bacterium]
LGGGALQSPDIRKLVLGDGQTAYLSCSARELYRRLNPADDRPLLYVRPGPGQTPGEALKERIRKLLEKRRRNYRRSHLTVSTTVRSPSQAAVQLYRLIRRYHGRN